MGLRLQNGMLSSFSRVPHSMLSSTHVHRLVGKNHSPQEDDHTAGSNPHTENTLPVFVKS